MHLVLDTGLKKFIIITTQSYHPVWATAEFLATWE